jgi:hypothetical protein
MSHSPSASTNEGLKSEALREALRAALAGKPAALEDLMCRHGSGNDPRPNLRLAAAFGAEMAALPGTVGRLLSRLGADDAAPDTPQVFLPIAAAYGWVGRLRAGLDVDQAWPALAELASDERLPVRLGTLDALSSFALRPGGGDALVARALGWLDNEDRDRCFGTAALVVEVFANRQVFAALGDLPPLLDYLARAIATVAGASRSAERSDPWRRLLLSLPPTLATVVVGVGGDERGVRLAGGRVQGGASPRRARGIVNGHPAVACQQGTGARRRCHRQAARGAGGQRQAGPRSHAQAPGHGSWEGLAPDEVTGWR